MLHFHRVKSRSQLIQCFLLRTEVFIMEQKVPANEEIDQLDATADHFLVQDEQTTIACCRAMVHDHEAKIGRFCVKAIHRGQGIGAQLLQFAETSLSRRYPIHRFYLSAQVSAIPFYEKQGYRAYGDLYLDANIPHRWMEKII